MGKTTTPTATRSSCHRDCYSVSEIFTLLVSVTPTTAAVMQAVTLSTGSTRSLLSLSHSHLPQLLLHRLLHCPPDLYSPCLSHTYHSHCHTDCYTVHQVFTLLVSVTPTTATATQAVTLSTRTLLSLSHSMTTHIFTKLTSTEWTGGHKLMVDLPSRLTLLYIYNPDLVTCK